MLDAGLRIADNRFRDRQKRTKGGSPDQEKAALHDPRKDQRMFTTQQQEAAEITRLQARSYRTSATSCSCPDAQHRGVRCKHQALIQGRLLAESPAEKAERRAEAKRVRDLLWD